MSVNSVKALVKNKKFLTAVAFAVVGAVTVVLVRKNIEAPLELESDVNPPFVA